MRLSRNPTGAAATSHALFSKRLAFCCQTTILPVVTAAPTTKLTCRYEAQRSSSGFKGVLGSPIMLHGDDDMSLSEPLFDVAMGLGGLFQRKASIYDRFYLPRLNKLFDGF